MDDLDDEEVLYLTAYLLLRKKIKKKKLSKNRNIWVRQIYKERGRYGIFHNLVREMELGDREFYFK